MCRKMKKYYGERHWSETLYFWTMDEEDVQWIKETNNVPTDKIIKAGDSEFFLINPPFHDSDKNSNVFFDAWNYGFDDTNIFITDTEEFNWYKRKRT